MEVALLSVAFVATATQMALAMLDLGHQHAEDGFNLKVWMHLLSWSALTWVSAMLLRNAIV